MNQSKVQHILHLCNMVKRLLFVLFVLLSIKSKSQSCLIRKPDLTNVDTADQLFAGSFINTYKEMYDVMISYNVYSNWLRTEDRQTVFAHKSDGWSVVKISSNYLFSDSSTTSIIIKKLNCSLADSLWNILMQNNMFGMKDESAIKTEECPFRLFDGAYFHFEIFSNSIYKKLNFYEPFLYEEKCPDSAERKQIINCVNAFEKYLGN
jgi:hypothetical protein